MASAGFGARNAATPEAAPPKLTKEGPNGASLSRMGSPQDGEALRKGWKADLKASGKIEGNKWWIIDPRKNEHVGHWDGVTSLALVFTALVTPYEVAFLPAPRACCLDSLFFINRVVDLIFVLDMCLQFCLAYPNYISVLDGTAWITDYRKIARNYLRG